MPIRPIVLYPDPRLEHPAQPVTVFDAALRDLARDLLATMHAASAGATEFTVVMREIGRKAPTSMLNGENDVTSAERQEL